MNWRKFLPLVASLPVVWLLTIWGAGAASLSRTLDPSLSQSAPQFWGVSPGELAKIEPPLLRELTSARAESAPGATGAGQTTFIVHLRERASLEDKRLPKVEGLDRHARLRLEEAVALRLARRQSVVASLQATASRSQAGIQSYLDQQRAAGRVSRVVPFWIFNGLAVTGDLDTVLALAARPEVEKINANHVRRIVATSTQVPRYPSTQVHKYTGSAFTWVPVYLGTCVPGYLGTCVPVYLSPSLFPAAVNWNIARIGADRVWQALGVTGQGVVVANVDSGVAWNHPALRNQYRGLVGDRVDHNYNWFDFTSTYPGAPGDDLGHGTHTMGTAVGGDGGAHLIGVAPGARWMAVKAFNIAGSSDDVTLHAAFQWLLAPTDLEGQNPDPTRAPDIVNSSWGFLYDGANSEFWDDVYALRKAGIVPVFAAGNSGPDVGSVEVPAAYPQSLAVGATDEEDHLAFFSGRGPSFWEGIKPDLSAPGVRINSSIPPSGYSSDSGTSFAAPHVAGLAALLLQADPSLTVDDIEAFLRHTASDRGEPGPDNLYGAGRIDAYTAVRWALSAGKLYGLVREAGSGQPVPGATVTGVRRAIPADRFTLKADERGVYAIGVPAGVYDVTATALGYRPETVSAVQVYSGFLSVRDINLVALPSRAVTGYVLEAETGRPLTATVAVLDTNLSTTTDAAGRYVLTLPPGTYTLKASAVRHRSQTASVEISAENPALKTQDFALPAAPSILFVDADAGAGTPVSNYYRWALDYLGYPYVTFAVTGTAISPTLPRLADYEVVMWAHNSRSPAAVEAENVLKSYLDGGGRLLLSGAQIGQLDRARDFYRNWLHATFVSDGAASREISGVPGDIFDGINLSLSDVFSYKDPNLTPDIVAPADPAAASVLLYANGQTAGLKADVCREASPAYRVVYLAFGFETAGPRPRHALLLDRAIQWLASRRPARGVSITPGIGQGRNVPGQTVTFTHRVVNQGENPDSYRLSLSGPWPAAVVDAGTGVPVTQTRLLGPCAVQTLRLEVQIPPETDFGAASLTTLRAVSETDDSIVAEATLSVHAFPNWQTEEAVPAATSGAAVAGIDCTIYRIGGEGVDGFPTNQVYAYDVGSRRWSARRPKPTAVSYAPAAVLGGKIYVPGGYNAGPVDTVEVYDPAADTWQTVPPLPQPLWGSAAAVAGGKLYVMGGTQAGSVFEAKTFAFDPATGTWSRKADMQVPRGHLAAATLDGLIYAAGGRGDVDIDLDTVEVYDPVADTWTLQQSLPTPRAGLGAATLGAFLYVAGGGWYSHLPVVERYDPGTNAWEAVSPLQSGRRSLGFVAAGGRLYAVSGYNGAYRPDVESLTLAPDLCASSKTAFPTEARPGEIVTYTVTLSNPGTTTLSGVRLIDPVPALASFVPGSATTGATYNAALNRIEWRGDVPPNAPVAIQYQVRLKRGLADGSLIVNTATIDDGQGLVLDRSAAILGIVPDLSSSIKAADPVRAASGDVVTYTIVLQNTNPTAATRASLLDPIPAHTRYVDGSVTGGAFYNSARNQIEWQGDLPRTIPVQYQITRSGSPDGPDYSWVEISGSGIKLPLGDDDQAEIPLPFSFNFYGEEHSRLFVASNGLLFFDEAYPGYVNKCIPGPGDTEAGMQTFIAPFWDDLNPGDPAAGGVYYSVQGVTPNRRLVVEWDRVPRYRAGPLTFEVILYEATGEIVFQYQNVVVGDARYDLGRDATVGIQHSATEGLQFSCNTPTLSNGLALRFAPPVVARVFAYQVRIDDGLPLRSSITNAARIDDGAGNVYTATATTAVNVPDVSSSRLTVDHSLAQPGSTLTYWLSLVNSGNVDIPTLQVIDPIPRYTTYVPDSATGGAIYNVDNNQVTWQGPLARGGVVALSFQVRLANSLPYGTAIVNTATLNDGQGLSVTRSVTTMISAPDLRDSEMLVSATQVAIGTPVTYTVRVRNTGTISTQVSLVDRLPPGLVYVPDSAWAGSGEAVHYDPTTQTLSWRGQVPARAVAEIAFRAWPRTTGVIVNTVQLDDGAGTLVEKSAQLAVVSRPAEQRLYIPLVARNLHSRE